MLVPSLDRFLSIEIRWRRNVPREQSDEDRRPHRLAAHGVLKRRSSALESESWPALEWARGFGARALQVRRPCAPPHDRKCDPPFGASHRGAGRGGGIETG